ncbi:hypothetical protein LCGC14_2793260, partial [marine sediment metagenome]
MKISAAAGVLYKCGNEIQLAV